MLGHQMEQANETGLVLNDAGGIIGRIVKTSLLTKRATIGLDNYCARIDAIVL